LGLCFRGLDFGDYDFGINPQATNGGWVVSTPYVFLHNTLVAYGIKFRHFR